MLIEGFRRKYWLEMVNGLQLILIHRLFQWFFKKNLKQLDSSSEISRLNVELSESKSVTQKIPEISFKFGPAFNICNQGIADEWFSTVPFSLVHL